MKGGRKRSFPRVAFTGLSHKKIRSSRSRMWLIKTKRKELVITVQKRNGEGAEAGDSTKKHSARAQHGETYSGKKGMFRSTSKSTSMGISVRKVKPDGT